LSRRRQHRGGQERQRGGRPTLAEHVRARSQRAHGRRVQPDQAGLPAAATGAAVQPRRGTRRQHRGGRLQRRARGRQALRDGDGAARGSLGRVRAGGRRRRTRPGLRAGGGARAMRRGGALPGVRRRPGRRRAARAARAARGRGAPPEALPQQRVEHRLRGVGGRHGCQLPLARHAGVCVRVTAPGAPLARRRREQARKQRHRARGARGGAWRGVGRL